MAAYKSGNGHKSSTLPGKKGWKADPLGKYFCSRCGRITPHEVRISRLRTIIFGRPDAPFISGCFPWLVFMILAVASMGILAVIIIFFMTPMFQMASFALGESLFPSPRRCAECGTTVTFAEARRAKQNAPDSVAPSAPPPPPPGAKPVHKDQQSEAIIRIAWRGITMLNDARFSIRLDGAPVGEVSIKDPYFKEIGAGLGRHVIDVQGPFRNSRSYFIECPNSGYYLFTLEYSRLWGNFADKCKFEKIE